MTTRIHFTQSRGDHVVHTLDRPATRRTFVTAGIGGILAAGVIGVTASTTAPPAAAAGSTAFGVRATGNENKAANSGSVSGMSFSASGISTETRPGYAKATVGSLTVGGKALGSVTATCEQGVTKVTFSGSAQNTKFFQVVPGKGGGPSVVGVTVTITDAKGTKSQTVAAAGVSCDKATTPPTTQPPTGKPNTTGTPAPTGKPTGKPATPTQGAGKPGTGKPGPGKTPEKDATPVPPRPGHHAVTG